MLVVVVHAWPLKVAGACYALLAQSTAMLTSEEERTGDQSVAVRK